MHNSLITTWVETFDQHSDRLAKFLRVVVEKLEGELGDRKINAKVSGRIKTHASLKKKLEIWSSDPVKQKRLKKASTVFTVVGDLVGVRVMTYVEEDRKVVKELIEEIFAHPPGEKDFDCEVKESTDRIKKDDSNFYRATHMNIGLKSSDLVANNTNLKNDFCELQITSMLAHVWNEIEHDIRYKAESTELSEDEQKALSSLGLLTEAGDNIIYSLMSANLKRLKNNTNTAAYKAECIKSTKDLTKFLEEYYGDEFNKLEIVYSKNIETLFYSLEYLNLLHPNDIMQKISPRKIAISLKEIAKSFAKYLKKHEIERPSLDERSSDILLLALLDTECQKISQINEPSKGAKPRFQSLAYHYAAFQREGAA